MIVKSLIEKSWLHLDNNTFVSVRNQPLLSITHTTNFVMFNKILMITKPQKNSAPVRDGCSGICIKHDFVDVINNDVKRIFRIICKQWI